MDGFHEAVNFLPENGFVRGYLPPRHLSSLRDGNPFCLITITAKTAKVGGDEVIGVQAGCLYKGKNERKNLSRSTDAPSLLYHYSCQEETSLLFSNPITNARNIILGSNLSWIRGPVKEIDKRAFNRLLKKLYASGLEESEALKLEVIEQLVKGDILEDLFSFQDEADFASSVLDHLKDKKAPSGNDKPQLRLTKTYQYSRDPAVAAYALRVSNGVCGNCKKKAPFISKSTGLPYLEVHHILPLKEGGKDIVDNVIALCPNCHREKHFG